jgi:AraC-like DNA-binding protein
MSSQRTSSKINISNGFLLKALISYIAVAIIPMLLLIASYKTGLDKSAELEKSRLVTSIERTCSAINTDAAKLPNQITAILKDNQLMELCRCLNPLVYKKNTSKVIDAQRRLSVIGMCNGLYDELLIYNIDNDYLISTESIYLKPALFPEAISQKFRDSDWPTMLLDIVRKEAGYRSKWITLPDVSSNKAAIAYIQPLYINNVNITSIYVLMLLSPEKLESYLESDGSISMSVIDEKGQLIAGNMEYPLDTYQLLGVQGMDELTGEDGNRYIVLSRPISYAGLNVIATLPYASVYERVTPLRNAFVIAACLVILTTFALCIGFAFINTRPIDHILVMLFGTRANELPKHMDNWHTLDSTIKRLIDDNYQLKRSVKLQADYLKASMYYELLTDWQGDESKKMVPRLRELNLYIEGEFMLVSLLFRSKTKSTNQTALSMTLHAFVQDAFPLAHHITETGALRFAAIIPPDDDNAINAQLEAMKDRAENILGMQLICVADKAPELSQLGRVSWEHSRTMELIMANEHTVHSDGEKSTFSNADVSSGVYPGSLDTNLSSAILSGDERLLSSTLSELLNGVCAGGKLPNSNLKLYMERCRMTIAQTVCRCPNIDADMALSLVRQLRYYNRLDNIQTQLEQMKRILEPVMNIMSQRAGSSLRKARITADIIDYLKEHFCDADMCLGTLTQHFNLEEGYISTLIKLETGTSFHTYLEQLRIEKACELLRNGCKIKDVAVNVGYNSPGNFRRAFIKITGKAPSRLDSV